MKELIEFIAQGLVDKPEAVSIKEVAGDNANIYELTVDQADLGKVIGKKGRTAKAIRSVMQAASAKDKTRSILEILG